MFSHIMVGANNIEASKTFYDANSDWIFKCSIEQFLGFIKDFSAITLGSFMLNDGLLIDLS